VANLPETDRELAARPGADLLYHALASSLLLAEGQILHDRSHDYRKLVDAALYIGRWLRQTAHGGSAFSGRHLTLFDAIAD